MRWRGKRQSNNVEDRRGLSGGKIAAGGGIGVIILFVLGLLTGKDFSQFAGLLQGGNESTITAEERASRPDDTTALMLRTVLASTEDVWGEIFRQSGQSYKPPKLVIFDNSVQSACGGATSAMGPFYCPADHKAYIDLAFCNELRDRFKAPGNFAVAYVLAHEIGHHIQNLLGTSAKVQSQRNRLSEKEYNKLSVQLELQADFYAGVWTHYSQKQLNWLDNKDIESALIAANAIGDDRLQMEAQGYVVPDAFTHGTSEQRMYWFRLGYQTGDLRLGQFDNIK